MRWPASPLQHESRQATILFMGLVVQEESEEQFLPFSLSAMRLAGTTFWYHTKHCCCLTEETCAESSQMSLVACGEWTGKEQMMGGLKGS